MMGKSGGEKRTEKEENHQKRGDKSRDWWALKFGRAVQ